MHTATAVLGRQLDVHAMPILHANERTQRYWQADENNVPSSRYSLKRLCFCEFHHIIGINTTIFYVVMSRETLVSCPCKLGFKLTVE